MKTINTTLKLITYGKGNKFDPRKFQPVKNATFIKPDGGLWASPVNSAYGWRDWCEAEEFGDLKTHFVFTFTGNIYRIDSIEDANRMPRIKLNSGIGSITSVYPNFEQMAKNGIDAIWLTVNGQAQARFSGPINLYGWDCESVLIMNRNCIVV